MRVNDVMTKEVVTVEPDMPLKEVAQVLVERKLSGVPVVDRSGKVVGVISDKDILYKERDPEESANGGLIDHLLHRGQSKLEEAKLHARTAGDAMTSPAVMIRPKTSVAEAATLMLERAVNRLPVVEDGQFFGDPEEGELVGILTRADLVRAFARSDDEIAADIREILEGELMLPPGHVTFELDRGELTLHGDTEWESHAEMLLAAIARVPGIVAIDSQLTWREKAPAL